MGEQKTSDMKKPRKTGLFHNNMAVKERFDLKQAATLNPPYSLVFSEFLRTIFTYN